MMIQNGKTAFRECLHERRLVRALVLPSTGTSRGSGRCNLPLITIQSRLLLAGIDASWDSQPRLASP
jgi:hypothetical protein